MKQRILTSFIACSCALLASFGLSVHAAELDANRADYNIPDLRATTPTRTTATLDVTAQGLKAIREERGSGDTIEDPELATWIQTLGNKLLAHAPAANSRFYFLLSKDTAINAYATQGGVIVINTGLVLATTSENELAAVIAHEIAHVTQQHIARLQSDSPNSTLMTGLGVLAGAAAASKSSDAAEAIIAGTIATQAHQQLSFSRQMETEADRVGVRILAAAGYDPQGMANFMEQLDRRSDDRNSDITQFLRDHPLSIDRVSDTRTQANQLPNQPVADSVAYRYAREKLRVQFQPNANPASNNDAALTAYVQALKQWRTGNSRAVLQALGDSATQLPSILLMAEAFTAAGQAESALRLLTPYAANAQENVLAPLAEAYIAAGQAAQAWQTVNRLPLTEQTSLEFLELRQRTAEQAGQTAEAYRSAAERSVRMGEYRQARAILEQATRVPGIPAATAARLQALAQDIARFEKDAKK